MNKVDSEGKAEMTSDVSVTISALGSYVGEPVRLIGWINNRRGSRNIQFIELRDGSGYVQCVVTKKEVTEEEWKAVSSAPQESVVSLCGRVVVDSRQIGGVEILVESVQLKAVTDEYPITPKEHGIEYLLPRRHIWLRSKKQWAIMRIRNRVITVIHAYLQDGGFIQLDSPILTGSAVEGTSTLFEVDYFGDTAFLSQSGQLHGEAMAMAFGKIYTFGPTFRAEKSKTRRHLTEFWMIEPEMAFYDLDMNMDLAEGLIMHVVEDVVRDCSVELAMLGRETETLHKISTPFPRITYSKAVELLRSQETSDMITAREDSLAEELRKLEEERQSLVGQGSGRRASLKRRQQQRLENANKRIAQIEEGLRNLPNWRESAAAFEWGRDFGGNDETVLTWHFDRPVIVHRYPAAIKAFYMKRDPKDSRLALSMDVLAPEGYGEIIGGGQRADDIEYLEKQLERHELPKHLFEWYLDLRRYGSVPHSGFGLGLERLVAWLCGVKHIRETIPFPRLMGRLYP